MIVAPVMNKFVPGFYSGDWIFMTLKILTLDEKVEFIDQLDVALIQPYVLFEVMRQVPRGKALAFHVRATQRLLKVYEADKIQRILSLSSRMTE